MSPARSKRRGRIDVTKKKKASENKESKDVSEQSVKNVTPNQYDKLGEGKEVKKGTSTERKNVGKRVSVSDKAEDINQLQDGGLHRKRRRSDHSKSSPDNSSQDTRAKRRGKVTARVNTVELSEDAKPEVKGKVEEMPVSLPSKKIKKGEDVPVPRPLKYESLGDGPTPVPSTGCKYMGSHVSAAGGIWNAFENAKECKSKSFAIFLRNQRQWNAKALDEETIQKWKEAGKDFAPHLILPHGSYLMNLGSPVPETLKKSRWMLRDELQRCQHLGIPQYNFHPGSTTGKISREECCKIIAESINIAHNETEGVICVLENMSCQGFTIGGDLHELRLIIEHVKDKSRVGVCLDTCHSHAAGYDLSTEEGFRELLQDFEKIIGWQFLRGLHINDSKGKAGDHLDRHENIGRGTIGMEGFKRVMNCDHFNDIPLILETPWTSNAGYASEVKKLESIIK